MLPVLVFTYKITMGRHKEWRKVAKRERRRKIRITHAKQRDFNEIHETGDYQNWLKEQQDLELYEQEQIEKINKAENEKWLQAEKIAMEQWQKLQKEKEIMLHKKHEKELKLKLEWEMEQKRREEENERLKELEKEREKKQNLFMEKLQQFISGNLEEPPPELLLMYETKPNSEPCPFFSKTACCRFGDQCSRNHQYPGISKVLLVPNFYTHFGLDNASINEYDTDVMLEYEESDTYKDFKEFFYDILPEFEKFGRIVQLKVCKNYEKHLRGNAYIEYSELRCAVAAYKALHTRWYGGRQLSLRFCQIASWKSAICGLQLRRCPKGRACNFLHVFRNPNNLFNSYNNEFRQDPERTLRTSRTSWRWSESPEPETRRRSSSSDRRHREKKEREHPEHRKDRKRSSHRSERSSRRSKH